MSAALPGLRGWTFAAEEVSAGIFTVRAEDVRGRSATRTGTDCAALLQEVWLFAVGSTFACEDYLRSGPGQSGWWDEAGQYWYIEPATRAREALDGEFLDVGGPGVDGIRWGYRRGRFGLWAFCPVDGEFIFLVDTVDELKTGYESGRIQV